MHKSQIFFFSGIFFIAGIFFASLGVSLTAKAVIFYFFLILLALFLNLKYFKFKKVFVLIISGCFLFGWVRFYLAGPLMTGSSLNEYAGQPVRLMARVVAPPDCRQSFTYLSVKAQQLFLPVQKQIKDKILIKTDRFPEFNYGDILEISGRLQEPKNFENFNYQNFLAKDDIYSVMYYPQLVLKKNEADPFFKQLYRLQTYLLQKINQILPEPQSSFLAGLLLGSRKGLDANLQADFVTTGISHIVAVSGYNISLVVVFLAFLWKNLYFNKKYFFGACVLAIVIFTVLTGASASVVRAAVMGGLVLLARHSGRPATMHLSLVAAAILMLLVNPKILVFDIGFQLSFAATLGLVYLSPKLQKYLYFVPAVFNLREMLATTLGANFYTLPLILYYFGRLSLISVLVNILVLPLIPWAMLAGFIALVASFVSLALGKFLAMLVYLILWLIIALTHYCAQLPYSSVALNFSWQEMAFSFGILLLIIVKYRR